MNPDHMHPNYDMDGFHHTGLTGLERAYKVKAAKKEASLKGQRTFGAKSTHKLSEEDKTDIRRRMRAFENPASIAKRYGLSRSYVLMIMKQGVK